MGTPITVDKLPLSGRPNTVPVATQKVSANYDADFSADADVTIQFNTINQQGQFGIPRTLFMDNGSNPSEVEVSVSITGQFFTIPANAQGYFHIEATEASDIRLVTDGGATDRVTVTIHNYDVYPSVWYRFGAFNHLKPIMAEGTIETGTDIDTAANNRPLLLGARISSGGDEGEMIWLACDAAGRLELATSASVIGGIFGSDDIGNPPTHAPVFIAGLDSGGDIIQVQLTDAGHVIVDGMTTLLADVATIKENTDKAVAAARTSVVGAAADTLILASNAARQGATVYNDSAAILYLALGAAAATVSNYTVQLAAGGYYEVPAKYSGEIRGIWAAATGNARVTELA